MTNEDSRSTILLRRARISYLIGLTLALIIASPVSFVPSPILKIASFCVFLFISVLYFVRAGGIGHALAVPGRRKIFLCALLPLTYIFGALISADASVAFFGAGAEVDTVFTTIVAFLALFLGFSLFSTRESARILLLTVSCSIGAAAVWQSLIIIFGGHAFDVVDKTANLIGKWNDLGLAAALSALLCLVSNKLQRETTAPARIAAGIVLLADVFILALVNFSIAWGLLILGSCAVALLGFRGGSRKTTAAAAALAAVSLLFVLTGGAISSRIAQAVSLTALEVRPNLATTQLIAHAGHSTLMRTLFGTGPNTFTELWLLAKPVVINQTIFWNVDFNTGFSVLLTAFVSMGVLGAIVWLLPFVLVIPSSLRVRRMGQFAIGDVLGISAVVSWLALFTYAASQNLVLLTFTLTGAAIGFAATGGHHASDAPKHSGFMPSAFAVLCIVLALWAAGISARRLFSESYAGYAAALLARGDVSQAASYNAFSQRFEKTPDNLHLAVEIDLAALQAVANQATSASATTQYQLTQILADAVSQGKAAVARNPEDYQAYVELARIYSTLISSKVPGAYENAVSAYKEAMVLNPTNPQLPLLLAQTEAAQDPQKNLKEIQRLVAQSLALKANYTDAYLFVVQMAGLDNDLSTATLAAKAAVASSPNQAPLWFELGLMYYSGSDWKDAAAALEQAVALTPAYANAKYFLGLSYYNLGRTDDAAMQFKDLRVSNPGSEEVAFILSNLQAGRGPFDNAQPPITPHPEKRSTAPLND